MASALQQDLDFPVPKFVEGGCLCGSLRYRVEFPENHDFKKSSCTCQCTQCRKHSSSLFWFSHIVRPSSAFKWTSDATLKHFSASPDAERAFCSNCGSLISWKPTNPGERGDRLCFSIGTVDPLYLFGEGANSGAKDVPEKGYGFALANGGGTHEWCVNEIPGVTDNIPWMGITRGQKFATD